MSAYEKLFVLCCMLLVGTLKKKTSSAVSQGTQKMANNKLIAPSDEENSILYIFPYTVAELLSRGT